MAGILVISLWTLGVIILLDIVAIEMAHKAERDRLSKMSQIERMEYVLQKYGKDGIDRLAEHKF
jgi:hypothetical protein